MTLEQIIEILVNKHTNLSQLRSAAIKDGDLSRVVQLDSEIQETQSTLTVLRNNL